MRSVILPCDQFNGLRYRRYSLLPTFVGCVIVIDIVESILKDSNSVIAKKLSVGTLHL